MLCSRCGKCCIETEMQLSGADMERLKNAGYDLERFARRNKQGYFGLRNYGGHCVFFDAERCRCTVYKYRPLGCRVYPVILCEEEGIIVDDLCPMGNTVSSAELERKGKTVVRLLQRIDREVKRSCL